jgi:hypothetical protein
MNGELTGHLAVCSHLLVSDDLHLLFHCLKHDRGDLQIPPESLHLRHRGRHSIQRLRRLRGHGQRQVPLVSVIEGRPRPRHAAPHGPSGTRRITDRAFTWIYSESGGRMPRQEGSKEIAGCYEELRTDGLLHPACACIYNAI